MTLPPSVLQAVRNDRVSGSERVADHAAAVLAGVARAFAGSRHFHDEVLSAAREVAAVRPSMAVVRNRVSDLACTLLNLEGPTVSLVPFTIAAWRDQRRQEMDRIVAHADVLPLDAEVATTSRSGTVDAVLDALAAARIHVAALEPGDAAWSLADAWRMRGRSVTLHDDVDGVVRSARHVLVGADAVFPDGRSWNARGTAELFEAARARGVPCWVAASTDKLEPWLGPDELDEPDVLEVVPAPDWFLTEQGILAPEDLAPHLQRVDAVRRRLGVGPDGPGVNVI